jgi:PAS domain S-box-containing protein
MPTTTTHGRWIEVGRTLAIAAAYLAAAWFGFAVFLVAPKVVLMWLPAGVCVAAVLRWGNRCLPGIFLGDLVFQASAGFPPAMRLPVALGMTAGTFVVAWLLRRGAFDPTLDRAEDMLKLGLAAALGWLPSAIVIVTSFTMTGVVPGAVWTQEFVKCALGDWMGVMTLAPLILVARRAAVVALWQRRGEFFLWLAAMAGALWIVFVGNSAGWSVAFVPLPLLAWAALRFGPAGTSLGLLIMAIVAAYGTSLGAGPFGHRSPVAGVFMLWIFLVTSGILGWLITALHSQLQRDVAERTRAEIRGASERTILEMLTSGAPLGELLNALTLGYERMFPGMFCSVLLLDAATQRLRHGAAPSLPKEYCAAIDGTPIGLDIGSCGTSAFLREPVLVADIATDPRWETCRQLALPHGLRACWSVPVISAQGQVLGTFALYYGQPQQALPAEVAAIQRGAHLAALAIERHQLLGTLRESQTRLETLIGNLPGIAFRCLHDAHWTFIFVSDHCEKITGYRRDELEGSRVISFEHLVHPEDRAALRANTDAAVAGHRAADHEYRIIDRAGVEHWVSERSTGVYDEAGALLYLDGFIQDITAAREAAREREEFARKVQETQKLESLGVLAGGIAHDFNNILTAILGNASLALNDAPPESLLRACLDDISHASLRAAELCNQMLAYSGRGRFVVQKLDLDRLIQETTQMLQISISKKAALHFELAKCLPPFEADATQIRQVIMNLVINASEAIGEDGGTITLRTGLAHLDRAAFAATVAAPDAAEGEYIFLEVSDTGAGMSAETQAKMFEPFFTTKFTGRGLGLAAVLGIVRGHRGALRVRSEPGRGTSFRVHFPAASGVAETDAAREAAPAVWRGQGTVLVVDDEAPVRATTARMLEALGFEIAAVKDGREAVRLFRETPARFTLVLLDLTMPGLGGEQTFMELNRLHPGARVVLMSGYNEQEAVQHFAGSGLRGFLQKPFKVEALREKLREVLG